MLATFEDVEMDLRSRLVQIVQDEKPPAQDASGAEKKNYTEKLSHAISRALAEQLKDCGLARIRSSPPGGGTQFMGGYGTKGVDVYLSDEKHGLILTSGVKGLLFDIRKNLKNRYRDKVMEALELHKRFPYAVCGHLLFLGKSEAFKKSQRFGNVLAEAVALLDLITGRRRPEDAAELYEAMGIVLLEPGDPQSIDMAPREVPEQLRADGYCERLIRLLRRRNPFLL